MKAHLSVEEFVDALDGTLSDSRRRHLDGCDVCQKEIAALTSVARDVHTTAPIAEPSPLFWEHFSRRVAEATAATSGNASSWWGTWRLAVAAGALVLLVAVVFVWRMSPASQESTLSIPAGTVDQLADDLLAPDDSLDFVVQLAANLSIEELQDATQPTRHVTAAAVDQLTPAQRAAFAKLVKEQIGGLE